MSGCLRAARGSQWFCRFVNTRILVKTRKYPFFMNLDTEESYLKLKVQRIIGFWLFSLKLTLLSLIRSGVWRFWRVLTPFMTPSGVTHFEDYCSIRHQSVDHCCTSSQNRQFLSKHFHFSGRLAANVRFGKSLSVRCPKTSKTRNFSVFHVFPEMSKSLLWRPRVCQK